MNVQQTNLDNIANNLANVNTTGFKRTRAEFQDLLYQTVNAPGADTSAITETPLGLQIGLGAKLVATNRIFSQGSLKNTGRPLDLAVSGNGFFQVTLPNGQTGYTRDGGFSVDETGLLVTAEGFTLEPNITVQPETLSISVAKDGTVSLDIGEADLVEAGQIQLVNFINPSGLKAEGGNIYTETSASGAPVVGNAGDNGFGDIQAGFVEISNVNVAEEMINMIIGQRAFEATSRSVRTADQILTEINAVKR
jgi:flagellar basal-body rod protein FlgG